MAACRLALTPRASYYCSVKQDDRVSHSIFMVVTEPGYDTKQGNIALDKLITCFWDLIEEDQVLAKPLKDFCFKDTLAPYLRAISVEACI